MEKAKKGKPKDRNNAIMTVKARKDRAQQNIRCRLYGYRDETINHIISECNKLAQERV